MKTQLITPKPYIAVSYTHNGSEWNLVRTLEGTWFNDDPYDGWTPLSATFISELEAVYQETIKNT